MKIAPRIAGALIAASLLAAPVLAQSPFGGFRHDETQPIEIAADSLEVQEANGIAIFRGAVVAGQGTLRLTAEELESPTARAAAARARSTAFRPRATSSLLMAPSRRRARRSPSRART